MNRFSCKNKPNVFCYVCGEFVLKRQKREFTNKLRKAYLRYFGCAIGDEDKPWAPHSVCLSCMSGLYK